MSPAGGDPEAKKRSGPDLSARAALVPSGSYRSITRIRYVLPRHKAATWVGHGRRGRGLRRREKNATAGGAGRFEKPSPDARAAPPENHESLINRKTVAEVPLIGLSFW